eukprot:3524439-Pleurochrysis_carterae.AAC.1
MHNASVEGSVMRSAKVLKGLAAHSRGGLFRHVVLCAPNRSCTSHTRSPMRDCTAWKACSAMRDFTPMLECTPLRTFSPNRHKCDDVGAAASRSLVFVCVRESRFAPRAARAARAASRRSS